MRSEYSKAREALTRWAERQRQRGFEMGVTRENIPSTKQLLKRGYTQDEIEAQAQALRNTLQFLKTSEALQLDTGELVSPNELTERRRMENLQKAQQKKLENRRRKQYQADRRGGYGDDEPSDEPTRDEDAILYNFETEFLNKLQSAHREPSGKRMSAKAQISQTEANEAVSKIESAYNNMKNRLGTKGAARVLQDNWDKIGEGIQRIGTSYDKEVIQRTYMDIVNTFTEATGEYVSITDLYDFDEEAEYESDYESDEYDE